MKEKKKEYRQLELMELQTIFVMYEQRLPIREISRRICRSPSAVHKVITDHRHPNYYVWRKLSALERAEHVFKERVRASRAARALKLDTNHPLQEYILHKLVEGNWSPEQIAAKVIDDLPGMGVCAKTIYTYIHKRRPDLIKYLHERGKKRRLRVTHRRGRFKQAAPEIRQIAERPTEVNDRCTCGNWEGDLVVSSKRGKGAVLSLRERKTRRQRFIAIPNLEAHTVRNYLIIFFISLPKGFRVTLTLDRGSEFAFSALQELEKLFEGLKIYYCDAYKPHQKGSVENGHRGFRWHFPKGTDFSLVSKEHIDTVQTLLNNKPMKLHGFKSPSQMWETELKSAA